MGGGFFLALVCSVVPTTGTKAMRLEAEKNEDEICGRNGVAHIGRFGTPGIYSKKMGRS